MHGPDGHAPRSRAARGEVAFAACRRRAQVLARSLEHGTMSPTWCTLDAIAEGLGTDSDLEVNAEREHTYLAAASAIARTLSHASPTHGAHIQGLEIGAGAGGTVSRSSAEAGRTRAAR